MFDNDAEAASELDKLVQIDHRKDLDGLEGFIIDTLDARLRSKGRGLENILIVVHGLRTWHNQGEALEILRLLAALGCRGFGDCGILKVILTEAPDEEFEGFVRVELTI